MHAITCLLYANTVLICESMSLLVFCMYTVHDVHLKHEDICCNTSLVKTFTATRRFPVSAQRALHVNVNRFLNTL